MEGPFTLPAFPIVRRRGDDKLRTHAGWNLRWFPAPLFGPALPTLGYHVYSNAGNGPINYSSIVATVFGLTWTSPPLAFPDTWMFGVRAFDANGEEQNLDAAVTIILDGAGNDITNRPKPPFALRAFPTAGGAIRVEWSYNTINPQPIPTGFYVYLGTTTPALLIPTSPISRGGISRVGKHGLARPGSVRWRPAGASGMDYSHAVATVSYQSAIAGTFVANIPGLVSGQAYQVAVRAFNSVAVEPNLITVTVVADAVGPGPVMSLSAIATA